MLLDKSHWKWVIGMVVLLGIATAIHVFLSKPDADPLDKRAAEFAFGVAAASMVAIAALYSIRKRLPRWPLGSARCWLKAHIWLGMLSVPLVMFHADFGFGNAWTRWTFILLLVVVVSGLCGLLIQHIVPRALRKRVPLEAPYDQVLEACQRLRSRADEVIMSTCGSVLDVSPDLTLRRDQLKLRDFYRNHLRPFLAAGSQRGALMYSRDKAESLFRDLRSDVERGLHSVVDELTSICDHRRQLAMQLRLRLWLRVWLVIHVPASIGLLGTMIVHIISAISSH